MDNNSIEQMYLEKLDGFQVDSIGCKLIRDVNISEESSWHSERRSWSTWIHRQGKVGDANMFNANLSGIMGRGSPSQ